MNLPEGMRIRPMAGCDLDWVMALARGCGTAPRWSRAEYLRYVEERQDSALRRFGLVAQSGEALAGFALLRALKTPDEVEVELESIMVAPARRGLGVGAALMAGGVGLAGTLGARRLDLEVRASNAAAIRLYERLGLKINGRRVGYYHSPEEDAALMRIEW